MELSLIYSLPLRFNVEDEDFFTCSVRSRIVDFILKRKRFRDDPEDEFAFGIERLLAEGTYAAAYPLHDVRNCLRLRHGFIRS